MTSEADDYEALADRLAHTAGRGTNGAVTRAFAVALRDHVEAKLAEVRAELTASNERSAVRWQRWQEAKDTITDRDRTIAEQSVAIERLREALKPFALEAENFDYGDGSGPDNDDWPDASSLGEIHDVTVGDCRKARTALQETADAK